MKLLRFAFLLMLISCAGTTDSIQHTVIVKGDKSTSLAVGDSPRFLSLSLEELYVGESANCSDLKLIRKLKNGIGVSTEIFNNAEAVLISARPENPSIIRCVAVRLSDIISFTPNEQSVTNIAPCINQNYDTDIFAGGINYNLQGQSTAGSNIKQSIYLIYSLGAPSFATDPSQSFTMNQALDTENPFDIILYADYVDQVINFGGNCSLNGFRLGMREGDSSL